MTLTALPADEVGFPQHPPSPVEEGGFFALSSHKRAREALRFGLELDDIGYNIFVIGEDRSGRMTATLNLLEGYLKDRATAADWVYLNNFRNPHRPRPYHLPAGSGRRFRDHMAAKVRRLRGASLDEARALVDETQALFGDAGTLGAWLTDWRADVESRLSSFNATVPDHPDSPERRYAVNLLVDREEEDGPPVVLEPNPTYENLFGRIEYTQVAGGLSTDLTMIRAGALHRANGGILVLRAEALAEDGFVWSALKAALRDRKVRIEERHRAGSIPLTSAPRPRSVPLQVKVVIVGAPRYYYGFFLNDPDFRVYFKIKADICDDLRVVSDKKNVAAYVGVVLGMARHHGATCDDDAIRTLLGLAARWAQHRQKLSSRLEALDDVIVEAALAARSDPGRPEAERSRITGADVAQAIAERRHRVAQAEDRMHRQIADGSIMLAVDGRAVGQINGLLVLNKIDHQYGCPTRITARCWVGEQGVINLDRAVAMSGPVQHKGMLGIEGYLAGCFARVAPVSFTASVTFEQNYIGVEGDSASLAETLVILSDLSGVALRQDIAVTGSVNQMGDVQPVGAVTYKIEGFFRACQALGPLTGTQGVVIPHANRDNVILHHEVVEAIAAGRFHLWTVSRVEDAVALFTGLPAGEADAAGQYPPDSVYGKVAARLAAFDRILIDRQRAVMGGAVMDGR